MDDISSFSYVNYTIQFIVISKLSEGELDPSDQVYAVDKEFKGQSQNRPSGETTFHQ